MIFRLKSPVAYVDTNLVGSGKLSRAAILGLGGGIWATSPGYTVRAMYRSSRPHANPFHFDSSRTKNRRPF
jgi:tRNA A37 threonylcarbamoyladenosine biosynthesis protein TsaE